MGPSVPMPLDPSDQDYQCCECFGTFEDDIKLGNEAEWAQCGCGRWIHEVKLLWMKVEGLGSVPTVLCNL